MTLVAALALIIGLPPPLTPDDGAARLHAGPDLTFELPLRNRSAHSVPAHISARLLDTTDGQLAAGELTIAVSPGDFVACVSLGTVWPALAAIESERTHWLRLHYQLDTPHGSFESHLPLTGLQPERAALAAGVDHVIDGAKLPAWALLVDDRGQPVFGSRVRFVVFNSLRAQRDRSGKTTRTVSEKEELAVITAITNAHGIASGTIQLPPDLGLESRLGLQVTAAVGVRIKRVSFDDSSAIVRDWPSDWKELGALSDETLYQPGQTMRLRALVRDNRERAVADQLLSFVIPGPNGRDVQGEMITSENGVAHADVVIPDWNDTFSVTVEGEKTETAVYRFLAARHEFPPFSIDVESDRTYYLAGQNARVTVEARAPQGEPVPNGQVTILREPRKHDQQRHQDGSEKSEAGDGGVTGCTDGDGRFAATIDLADAHDGAFARYYDQTRARFRDVGFIARVTDPDTGRSAERWFHLRVTREPIHVFAQQAGAQHPNLPLAMWVSTTYADGSPAACRGDINGVPFATSRFGITRVELPFRLTVDVRARDDRGNAGTETATVWSNDVAVRIAPAKTIHASGEPIAVTIHTSEPTQLVAVALQTDEHTFAPHVVESRDHRAHTTFRYDERMRGMVLVIAYAIAAEGLAVPVEPMLGTARPPGGSEAVLFPDPDLLRLDLSVDHAEPWPRGRVTLSLHTKHLDDDHATSSTGLVALDRGLLARRTRDGAEKYKPMAPFGTGCCQIAGHGMRDILWSRPQSIDDDFDELADAVVPVVSEKAFAVDASGDLLAPREAFRELHQTRVGPLLEVLQDELENSGATGLTQLEALVARHRIDAVARNDAWGRPIRRAIVLEGADARLELRSDGPDRTTQTDDDFVIEQLTWNHFVARAAAIVSTIPAYYARTGIVVADGDHLADVLRASGIRTDEWREPTGGGYRLEVHPLGRELEVSAARDRDGEVIWRSRVDFFGTVREAIYDYIYARSNEFFPSTPARWSHARQTLGLPEVLHDAWGRPFDVITTPGSQRNGVVDDELAVRGQPGRDSLALVSCGEDGILRVESFEPLSYAAQPRWAHGRAPAATTGPPSITGTIVDEYGRILPGVIVDAELEDGSSTYWGYTIHNGRYVLAGLPAGSYRVRVSLPGIHTVESNGVLVAGDVATRLHFVLTVAGSSSD